MSTETSCHFCRLRQVSKKCLKSDFIHFLHDFMHVYSPRAGADNPLGTKFDVNRKVLSLYAFVASFKEMSLKSDFILFFYDLIHVYSPGAGGIQPPRDKNFDVNRNFLLQFSRKSLWSLILYNFFHDFIHAYSPGAGADSPRGQSFDVTRNVLSFYSFVASF